MINMIQVQTIDGLIDVEVIHKNGALQVVQAQTQDPEVVFYSTIHNNGLRVPSTDTDVVIDAILICDWCVENFPEFLTEIFNMSKARHIEFSDRLRKFRVIDLKDWEDDD